MNQNDKRNAKISEVCRVLANACMSENTSLYPEDIMTFVNESRNSDIKEFLALHTMLNEIDATRRLEKNIECAEAWRSLRTKMRYSKRRQEHRARYWTTHQQMCYCLGVEETWEKLWQDYAKAEAQLVRESNNTLEEEVAVWDWLTSLPCGIYTDNDIACQTAYEIAEANAKREHMLSKIACDAVKKHVYYGTVVRFMNEMCKDDKERAFFLQEYSNAQWRDGRFN